MLQPDLRAPTKQDRLYRGCNAKERGAGSLGYAEAMLVAYNRKCKYTLRMTKLHSGKVAVADDFVEENEEPLADDPVLEE